MAQERVENSTQTITFNNLISRAPEWGRLNEYNQTSARSMVVRMFYFVQATSPDPRNDRKVPQIGASLVTGNFDRAIAESQSLYEDYYLKSHPEEPATIFEKLKDTANKFNQFSGGSRLHVLKGILGDTHTPAPELVAERRFMRREAWEEQLEHIDYKLKAGNLLPRKESRLRMDRAILADLLFSHKVR